MRKQSLCAIISLAALMMLVGTSEAQTAQSSNHYATEAGEFKFLWPQAKTSRAGFRLMPAGAYATAAHSRSSLAAAANPVTGSGSTGQLAKWSGALGSNTFTLGNSVITEDKFGQIGIGTTNPTSPLTVVGLIETINPNGGIKFPDGTIQTTASLSSIFHDATLMGNGTAVSLLGIAPGGVNTVHLANLSVSGPKIANGAVVRTLNGLSDTVSILAGNNVTITPGANSLTIDTTGLLGSVAHDGTLTGDGTTGSLLGIPVPLSLSGSRAGPILFVSNSNTTGIIGLGSGTSSGIIGLSGSNLFPLCGDSGVCGSSLSNKGVIGTSRDSFGVAGFSTNSVAVFGNNSSGSFLSCPNSAICGTSTDTPGTVGLSLNGSGVFGRSSTGLAGEFDGDVSVTGMLSKGGGSFKIDHPLDPENKYLYHSFVESPDMKNIYDGNITTDESGEAVVRLPDYFEALNKDFRYQLTVIGTFAQAIVAEEIKGNSFTIKTSAPNVKVSWQVTGIRQDGWADKNRIQVEVEKTERERGFYLHPEAFGKPEERSIQYLRHPEIMRQAKERREKIKLKSQ